MSNFSPETLNIVMLQFARVQGISELDQLQTSENSTGPDRVSKQSTGQSGSVDKINLSYPLGPGTSLAW